MDLTRVTSGKGAGVGPAAATGGDVELLSLLFGAESGAAASAFPATLQEALATGGALGEEIAAAEIDGDGDTSADDEPGTSLDAALAAALGLAAVASPPPEGAGAENAGGTDLEAQVIDIEAGAAGTADQSATGGDLASTSAGASGAAPGATAAAESTATVAGAGAAGTDATLPATAGDDASAAASATRQRAAVDEAAAAARPVPDRGERDGAAAVGGRDLPPAGLTGPDAASGPVRAAGAGLVEVGTGRPTPAGPTPGAHHGIADGQGVTAASFSSDGSEQQALDLGASDRQAFALVGKPATTSTSAAAPEYEGEKLTVPSATAGSGGADAATPLPPATSSAAPPDGTTTRLQHSPASSAGIEPRWSERVVDALRLSALRGGGDIRLQLEPEGLGHVDVRLHLHPDGVRAVIVAEHESTRALLSSQQHVLQDAFNRSDLRLSGFSVDVGSGGGAASFGRDGEPSARSAPPPVATASPLESVESWVAPVADGRVSVRV